MGFAPQSRLDDIHALMDSYALEWWKDGLLILCAPLHWCAYEPDEEQDIWHMSGPPRSVEIRLVRFEPPPEGDILEGIRERNTRWPFFVNEPVEIWLSLRDQWWLYKFSPGKFYEEFRMGPLE